MGCLFMDALMGRAFFDYHENFVNVVEGFLEKSFGWKLSPTNHDPKVVCRFYLEGVEKAGGTHLNNI